MSRLPFLVLAIAILPGCSDPLATHMDSQSISSQNALSYNRLSMNRLSMNRLSMNRLSMNRLSMNRLSMNSLESDGLEETEEGREALTYVAKCALNEGDVLVANVDGVEYQFPGLLGVAPEWEDGALSPEGEQLVSACLLAHVNAFGVSVPVSIRSWPAIAAMAQERRDFPIYEATFFGDVFADELKAFSCAGDSQDLAAKYATSRELRVCADQDSDCAIVAVGRCLDVCGSRHPHYGWRECVAGGVVYGATTSVFLTADLATDTPDCSGSGDCSGEASGADARLVQDCERNKCQGQCGEGAVCRINGHSSKKLEASFKDESMGLVDCSGAKTCKVESERSDSLEVDCTQTGTCEVTCSSGAECLVQCSGSDDCRIDCDGDELDCGGDLYVCNRSCP